MTVYRVAELFSSINGEGTRAGQLAVFVRFQGCNLACAFCDTKWANEADAPCREMTAEEIVQEIRRTGIVNVTLTGGEPLLQTGIGELLERLGREPDLRVEIETNGSIDLTPYRKPEHPPCFTMDYKLPCSGMEQFMCEENLSAMEPQDTVKFVAGSRADLERAAAVIGQYDLTNRCHVYLSPVFGDMDPADIVEYMKQHCMNHVNLQLQLHKMIWDPDARGV